MHKCSACLYFWWYHICCDCGFSVKKKVLQLCFLELMSHLFVCIFEGPGLLFFWWCCLHSWLGGKGPGLGESGRDRCYQIFFSFLYLMEWVDKRSHTQSPTCPSTWVWGKDTWPIPGSPMVDHVLKKTSTQVVLKILKCCLSCRQGWGNICKVRWLT